jgi:hypothetical protein
LGIWLITAAAYLPACSHGSTRAKHGRSSSSSSLRFRRASAAPILTAAALRPRSKPHGLLPY